MVEKASGVFDRSTSCQCSARSEVSPGTRSFPPDKPGPCMQQVPKATLDGAQKLGCGQHTQFDFGASRRGLWTEQSQCPWICPPGRCAVNRCCLADLHDATLRKVWHREGTQWTGVTCPAVVRYEPRWNCLSWTVRHLQRRGVFQGLQIRCHGRAP